MKPSTSLSKVFPSIHQPLPLTRHQSQRLLDSLKSSFRANLDREHGWLPKEHSVLTKSTDDAALAQSRRPTDDHVRAILSNPVIKNGVGLVSPAVPPKADPMVVFERAFAKGIMNLQAAHGCLLAKYKDAMNQSSAPTFSDAVESMEVSTRVQSWLESEGMMENFDFIQNFAFTSVFICFMVGEKREHTIWSWITRLVVHDEIPKATEKAQALLNAVITSKTMINTTSGMNLDPSLETLIEARTMFQQDQNYDQIMFVPWKHLSWTATVEAWKRPSPSEDLFNQYVDIGTSFKKTTWLYRAHLDIHHPTHPDYHLAMTFLEKNKELLLNQQKEFRKSSRANRTFLMAIDTAKLLSQIGKSQEAQSILNLIENLRFGPTPTCEI